jgi:cytochrome b561
VEFGLALVRMASESSSVRAALLALHEPLGLLIAAAMLARIGARLRLGLAAWTTPVPTAVKWISAAVHGLAYLLLLSLPALGLALVNARGHAVALPGLGALAPLLHRDLDLADALEDWHGRLAWLLLGVIAAHVAAACWHHWIRRDGLMHAIWPRRACRHLSL